MRRRGQAKPSPALGDDIMAEDREPMSANAGTDFLPAFAPNGLSGRSNTTRLATWPLVGFLVGFILQPRALGAAEYVAMSTAIGVCYALVGLIAALVCSRWLGATKTAMPYAQGQRIAIIFNVAMIAVVAMKILDLRGLLPLLIGLVPIFLVVRGTRLGGIAGPAKEKSLRKKSELQNPRARALAKRRGERIVNHAGVSEATRKEAARALEIINTYETHVARRRARHLKIILRCTSGVLIVATWAAYFWLSTHRALARAEECQDSLSGSQMEMCVRHAMEAREMAWHIGVGGPLLAMIIVVILLNLRSKGVRPRLK